MNNQNVRIIGKWKQNANGKGYTWHTSLDSNGDPVPYNPRIHDKNQLPEYSHPTRPVSKDK